MNIDEWQVIDFVKQHHRLLIGELEAERVLLCLGEERIEIGGRDLVSGRPKRLFLDLGEMRKLLTRSP